MNSKVISMRKLYYVLMAIIVLLTIVNKSEASVCYDENSKSDSMMENALAQCSRMNDSIALVNFYETTNGQNWTMTWDLTRPMTAWTGVLLNDEGCVGGLSLPNNNLTGFMPNLNLPALIFMDLSENNLFGGIPSFSNMNNIEILVLSDNDFTGFVPHLQNKPELRRLELNNNLLSGSLPGFEDLVGLEILDLRNNALMGVLPDFAENPILTDLLLSNNAFGGEIPNFQAPSLITLELSNNNLFGNIPSFTNLSQVQTLNLSFNNLTGNVPGFSSLVGLQNLNLNNNNLFGQIPNFNTLLSLQTLWMANNRLSGEVPDFTFLPGLIDLNLNNNNLQGLPAFSNLPVLEILRVSRNMLTFEDLIPNIDVPELIYTYNPQDTIGNDTIIFVDLGTTYTIDLGFDEDVEDNVYRWYRDNVLVAETDVPSLDVELFSLGDRADYFCVVSNPQLPFLQVVSRTVSFLFNGGSGNDLCALAFDLTDSLEICNNYVFFDLALDVLNPSCSFGVYNVWFKFTAKGNRAVINIDQAGFENPFLALWDFGSSPCVASEAIEVACGESIDADSLIAGKEYYIAVYGINDGSFETFNLCLLNNEGSISTENDFPCNARGIAPNVCLAGNTALANPDVPNPDCPDFSGSTVWYKTRLSTDMNTLNVDLSNNNFFGDVALRVGVFSDSCGGTFVPVANGSFCERARLFSISGLQSGIEYYIQIGTSPVEGGAFLICLSETGRDLVCGENSMCSGGPNGPIDLPVYTDGGNACYAGCTTDAPAGINQGDNSCYSFYAPTVWYTVTTDDKSAFLSLDVQSTEMLRPYFSIFKTDDCNEFENIICKVEGNGTVNLERFPIEPNTKYYIAVSDFYGRDGLFSICLSTYENSSVCNVSNQLVPINTSMGSPLEGPYRPGEQVSFCYTIDTWQFVSCNWLQAVVPSFGPCWDPISFEADGQPAIIDNFFTPFSVGEWVWLEEGTADYNLNNLRWNLREDDPLPGGWYFINQNSGVSLDSLNVNNSLGDGIQCALDNPSWQICFTLTASQELNCSEISNCNISMKTYTDGEVGGRSRAACLLDVPTYYNAYLDCCNNPVVEQVLDTTICSGEEINIPLIANDDDVSFNIVVSNNPNIEGASGGNVENQISQTIINTSFETQTFQYTIVPESEGCLGSPVNFTVTVFPEPRGEIEAIDSICQEDIANLAFAFQGESPFEVIYSSNGIVQPSLSTNGNTINTTVMPLETTTYQIDSIKGANDCVWIAEGIFTEIVVNPISIFPIDTIICQGEEFVYEDVVYDETGVYEILFEGGNEFGCDSTVRIDLTVGAIYRDSIQASICFGEEFVIGNNRLTETGNYVSVLSSEFECDSTIFLNLKVGAELVIEDTLIMNDPGDGSGAIGVTAAGGFPPYSYSWSNGATSPLISNLTGGVYTLTVTDSIDCEKTFDFIVRDPTPTNEINLDGLTAKVWPVPVHMGDQFFLETQSNLGRSAEIKILNMTGKVIGNSSIQIQSGETMTRLTAPTVPGVYLIELMLQNGQRASLKLLVI